MALQDLICQRVSERTRELTGRTIQGDHDGAVSHAVGGTPSCFCHMRRLEAPIQFMRKLDVKEIHGYNASLGLKLLKPEVLGKRKKKNGSTDL